MALTNYNDIIAALSAGDRRCELFFKTSTASGAGTAGRFYDLFAFNGYPTAGSYSGSAGVATQLNDSSAGAIYHGGNVSPDIKYLKSMTMMSPTSTANPSWLMLVDLLLYYPGLSANSPTALDNTATLPRYTTGEGVFPFAVVTTALGAASPNMSLTYTNSAGTGSRTSQNFIAPANSLPTPTLIQTGTPRIGLAAGDLGCRSIQSYTINSGGTATGAFSLVLCKEIAKIPLHTTNQVTERDYVTQVPSLPIITDGACLSFIIFPGGNLITSASIVGELDFVWG